MISSTNPATGKLIKEFDELDKVALDNLVTQVGAASVGTISKA